MEEIIKEEWFWIGIFSILSVITGSLLTIIANQWKEKSSRTTQIKIEKIKMYDERKFHAYLELYEFISIAYSLFDPTDDPRQNFVFLMKKYFFKKVKIHYPDLNLKILNELNKTIEKIFDEWENKT